MNSLWSWRRGFEFFVRTKIIFIFLFGSGSLFALPQVNCPKPDPLLDLVNYVGDDKREYLDDPNSKLDLSPEERDRIRKVTGLIKCVDPKGGFFYSSGSLAGKGDEIITTAHTFKDIDTGKFYEPLSECTFTNFDTPPATSKMAITKSHSGLMIGKDFPSVKANDYAFAKLVTPIVSAKPFPVDLSDTVIHNYKSTILVSAFQDKMPSRNSKQPIVEPCEVQDQGFFGVSTNYYNDCTTFGGASGGAQLARSSKGELVLKAIEVGGGPTLKGDYNRENGSFDHTLAIGTRVLSDLKKFDPSITIGNGGIDDSH